MVELAQWVERWGRTVILDSDQWYGHLLALRPALVGREDVVRLALSDPDEVTEHEITLARECYYRFGVLPGVSPRLVLKVVVQFLAPDYQTGYVVTAYPARSVKRKEKPKWRR